MSGGAQRPSTPAPTTPAHASPLADGLPHDPLVVAGPVASAAAGQAIGPWVVRLDHLADAGASALGIVLGGVGGRVVAGTGRTAFVELPEAGLAVLQQAAAAAPAGAIHAIAAAIAAYRRQEFELRCGALTLRLGARPRIMGILNCTPDSFWHGSTAAGDAAVARGVEMVAAGADLLDVGGESTRPQSEPVSPDVEIERVCPVIRELCRRVQVPISIDTSKRVVAEAAVDAGATMINDISGLTYEPELGDVAARHGLPLVVMHMRGRPGDMYERASYDDVVAEVAGELRGAVRRAHEAGVQQVIVDPGIGFAKRADASLTMLNRLAVLRSLGCPILVGPSRKSFIGAVLDLPVQERLEGTAAAVTAAVLGGAHILRVHDVEAMRRVATVAAAIRDEGASCSP